MIRALLIVLLSAASAVGQGYVCAEGGGNAGKGAWADEVFGWMVEKGHHGKVVLLGAVKLDEDERPAMFTRLGAASAESLVVTEENADTQETYDAIASASVVFIRGGAQDRYVRWWKGKKTQQAIVDVWKKGGVVAGTSAGCAVLGEVVYDSLHGSLTAREALADGRHEHLSLTTGFLNLVPGVLFDTHFTERGRLARLPVMLAMCKEDLKRDDIVGIGVDPRTAVCVGPDGIAEIRGEGTATFLTLAPESRVSIRKGTAPAVLDIRYTQLFAGHRYDLKQRVVTFRPDWIKPAFHAATFARIEGSLVSLDGALPETAALATIHPAEQPDDAWIAAAPASEPGENKFCAALAVRAFSDRRSGNSMAAVQGAVAADPHLLGIWLDESASVQGRDRRIDVLSHGADARSILILDGTAASQLGWGPAPCQRPAIEGARLHVIPPGWTFDRDTHGAMPTSDYPTTDASPRSK